MLRCLLAVALTIVVLGPATRAEAGEKPNIVFILADDLGWSDTTLYGQTEFYQTPHLERLAARGMTFSRAYTASPLCSPTRASILTGLHPARTGLTAPNCHTPAVVLKATADDTAAPNRKLTTYRSVTRLDPKYETLAERYRAEGYATGHFGKWHLGAAPYSALEHGFDVDIPNWHGPGPAGSFVAPWKFPDFKENYPKEHIEDRMGDEAVAFIEAHRDEPFLLNYWQFSVHAPFDAKAELIESYRPKVDPEDAQRSPTYAAMVHSLDDNVGKMLDALDRLGLAERTIIVFFSDNGGNMYNEVDGTTPTSNRPLRGGKATAWEGGVRVPAVVVWPGEVAPGSRSDALLTSTDFYPTLLEMTGLEPSPDQSFDGVSVVPALHGEDLERESIFTFFPHSTKVPDTLPPSATIHQGDWKLIRLLHHGDGGEHVHQLYHLGDDIGERRDLAAEKPDRVGVMARHLDAFLATTGAVYPKANPAYDRSGEELASLGWKAGKGSSLNRRDGRLQVSLREDKAQVVVAPPSELEAEGDLSLRLHLRSDASGSIALRWGEQGVKPLYFKDRLVESGVFPANEWVAVEIAFTAVRPLTSMRLDFLRGEGVVEIGYAELIQQDEALAEWHFGEADAGSTGAPTAE